jgi:hypothetical protein
VQRCSRKFPKAWKLRGYNTCYGLDDPIKETNSFTYQLSSPAMSSRANQPSSDLSKPSTTPLVLEAALFPISFRFQPVSGLKSRVPIESADVDLHSAEM